MPFGSSGEKRLRRNTEISKVTFLAIPASPLSSTKMKIFDKNVRAIYRKKAVGLDLEEDMKPVALAENDCLDKKVLR